MKPRLLLLLLITSLAPAAHASGPRWVTGKPFFTTEGNPVIWYTDNPKYFTDPGDLSPYVNHAAADAIVAAAAAVWSVPTARIGIVYGGTLAEHVSSSNTYTATGIVFPSDVQSTNYLNIQIAVVYDTDGSITDLMLGSGASAPSGCRQNAVTESVDSFSPAGYILHAILVLNGRCTGPAPEQQLQLQYQLMRAFGRVIGLAWSQTNDNVFTGNPRPTYQQALYWPIMHPIDVICSTYTYQCMPQPFMLRDDDISGLGLLYQVGWGSPTPPGKTETFARSSGVYGNVTFPSGQGMQGVNIVVHRLEPFWNTPEAWESTSAVTGARFRRQSANPINGSPTTRAASMGSTSTALEGYYEIHRIPLYDSETWQNLVVSTQPINPLYVGAYAVSPYNSNSVDPSGAAATQTFYVSQSYGHETVNFTISDAATGCTATQDGTESSPAPVAASGWWTGNICTYGHAAWSTLAVKANRSLTVEVTALNTLANQSIVTTSKTMPVIGIWNATDATGTLPTVASATGAFNSSASGTTTVSTQTTQPKQLRIAIADQRGDGRPDFPYQAHILYADSISPANVPSLGGSVTITGIGFRPGNTVTVNGLPATVTNWTSNSITATVPNLHASTSTTADITVSDLTTGGSTTMTSALNYAAPQPTLILISAPSGQLFTNTPAPTPFAVKALQQDGATPIPNTTITLSVTAGSARLEVCGSSTCTLATDASGLAATAVTPLTPGTITLTATSAIGTVTASFTAIMRIQTITALNSTLYLAAQTSISWPLAVTLSDNGAPTTNVPVQWTALTGPITLTPTTSNTDAQSTAQTTASISPLSSNQQAKAQACAWPAICTTFTVTTVDPSQWQLDIVSGSAQSVSASDTLAPIVFRVLDSSAHPIAGATVTIHQTVEPWTQPCPSQGRCPIAPAYNSSTTTLTSALDGTVTITPLALPTDPEVTHIAAATGTQGFLSLTLQKHP